MEEADDQVEPSELFRELLRIFPTAKLDDYYKNGVWKVDTILIDTELIEAHRMEAGAPEPPSLDEVALPELPARGWLPDSKRRIPPVPAAPVRPATVTPPKPQFGVVTPKPPLIRPPKPAGAALPKQPGMVGAGPAASPELRDIALFIAKWKCEATKTKLLLARLTPANRKLVMEGFEHSDDSGTPSTVAFEKYIQDFERGGKGVGEEPGPRGVARPPPSEAFAPDAKRPRIAEQTPKRMGAGHLTTPKSGAATTAKAPAEASGRSAGIGAVPKGKVQRPPPAPRPTAPKPPAAPKSAAPKPWNRGGVNKTETESRRGISDSKARAGYAKEPEAAPGQLIQNLLSAM